MIAGKRPLWPLVCGLALLAPTLLSPRPLGAQSSAAMAEILYRDGKKLLDEKKYAEACPKLAESERLEPAGGTELALALCYDEWGKVASAWAAYRDALASARKVGRKDREKASLDAINRLEPQLPRLTIKVAPEAAALEGLEVKRDGLVIGKIIWGTPVPVDPGDLVVEARAPGHQPFKTTIKIGGPREERTVSVPPLSRAEATPPPVASSSASTAAPPPSAPPSAPPTQDGAPGRPVLGYVATGVGVVGLGLGVYFGARFFSKKSEANDICPEKTCSDRHAVDLSEQAQTAGIVGSVSLAVGLAGLGVGSYLLFVAPSSQQAARRLPSVGVAPLPGGFSTSVSGQF